MMADPDVSVPAAGATVVRLPPALNSALSLEKQSRRILRNNIDALQTFLEENNNQAIVIDNLIKKLAAAKPNETLMIDGSNYVIVNPSMVKKARECKKTEEFKLIIHAQISEYISDKVLSLQTQGKKESRLLTGYHDMINSPDTPQVKKFKEEMHSRAQVKKWSMTEKLPDELIKGLNGNQRFVGFTQANPDTGKSKLKDLAKIYENTDKPVFKDNQDLLNKLNTHPIEMKIGEDTYFIRGKIKNDVVVFVKCLAEKDDASKGLTISQSNVDRYVKDNKVDSFAVAVMLKLGEALKTESAYKDVIFKGPETPAPAPAPKKP